jgi:predicted short-subunit dehydrogenase-like oxidoreductase (DUF2520 family)
MGTPEIRSVSFIGAGNVASHLATGLFKKGMNIHQVWSRNSKNSVALASQVNAEVCEDLSQIKTNTDLFIISVKDDAMEHVLKQLPASIPAIVHTSGSLPIQLLEGLSQNTGVLYPLQSFNKDEVLDWNTIPICIEASNTDFSNRLSELAQLLSAHVEYVESAQRVQLHIAAVFANNFTNYLFSMAYELVAQQNIPFSLLTPLIRQTAERLGNSDPFLLQTGPARRNDTELIKKHIALLSSNPEAAELYDFITQKIIKKTVTD